MNLTGFALRNQPLVLVVVFALAVYSIMVLGNFPSQEDPPITVRDAVVVSFMPGMEFVIPVGKRHLLRPHADVGVGFASSIDQAEFLASIGLRTEFVFAGEHYFAGLEPGFLLSNRASVDPANDLIFSPFMTVSGRRVLGFTIDGHQPDAGVFVETGYDFNALEFTSVRAVENATRVQYEVGVGFGFSQSQPKIWFFRIPRVRVGYRFGDLEGWRVRIGGDWLNSVVGLSQVRRG